MITRKLERERAQKHGQDMRHTPDPPPPPLLPITVAPHRFRFDGNYGRVDRDEEVLHWFLDQGGRGADVLVIAMVGVEVVAVDITVEGVQSVVNETADEENK